MRKIIAVLSMAFMVCSFALAGPVLTSESNTNPCPPGYYWDAIQKMCVPETPVKKGGSS
jgi:hypothetical protein